MRKNYGNNLFVSLVDPFIKVDKEVLSDKEITKFEEGNLSEFVSASILGLIPKTYQHQTEIGHAILSEERPVDKIFWLYRFGGEYDIEADSLIGTLELKALYRGGASAYWFMLNRKSSDFRMVSSKYVEEVQNPNVVKALGEYILDIKLLKDDQLSYEYLTRLDFLVEVNKHVSSRPEESYMAESLEYAALLDQCQWEQLDKDMGVSYADLQNYINTVKPVLEGDRRFALLEALWNLKTNPLDPVLVSLDCFPFSITADKEEVSGHYKEIVGKQLELLDASAGITESKMRSCSLEEFKLFVTQLQSEEIISRCFVEFDAAKQSICLGLDLYHQAGGLDCIKNDEAIKRFMCEGGSKDIVAKDLVTADTLYRVFLAYCTIEYDTIVASLSNLLSSGEFVCYQALSYVMKHSDFQSYFLMLNMNQYNHTVDSQASVKNAMLDILNKEPRYRMACHRALVLWWTLVWAYFWVANSVLMFFLLLPLISSIHQCAEAEVVLRHNIAKFDKRNKDGNLNPILNTPGVIPQ